MARSATVFQCPNCLANLDVDKGRTTVCPYCGATVQFAEEEGSVHVHAHIYDEAELKRIEIEEERRRQERVEREEQEGQERESLRLLEAERIAYKDLWIKCLIVWVVALAVGKLLSATILPKIGDDVRTAGVVNLLLFTGSIALFLLRPSAYVRGEEARSWRRLLIVYLVGFMALLCIETTDAVIVIFSFWLFGGLAYLIRKRPGRTKKPEAARE